jgi:hypothetical protein
MIAVIILAGALFVFQPSADCRKESIEPSSADKTREGKLIWENLSQQFFSTL